MIMTSGLEPGKSDSGGCRNTDLGSGEAPEHRRGGHDRREMRLSAPAQAMRRISE
jgi:hypothetical protein